MKLEYFGHSFWKITSGATRIVIDPFDDIGYPMPTNLAADYILISHEHHDHNNIGLIMGNPIVIRESGLHQYPGLKIELISVFHDNALGTKRGRNNIIKLEADGVTLVHCGDLGHVPDEATLKSIHNPDILLIPVGELYTLSLDEVWETIKLINPGLIFPMHYRTSALSFNLGELDTFLQGASNVLQHPTNALDVTADLLAEYRTIVMNWQAEG